MKILSKSTLLRIIDFTIFLLTYVFAVLLLAVELDISWWLLIYALIIMVVFFVSGEIFKIYRPIWKYAGIRELSNLFFAILVSNIINIPCILFFKRDMSLFFFATFVNIGSGLIILLSRIVYELISRKKIVPTDTKEKTIIIGGGSACSMLMQNMGERENGKYHILAIFDDDKTKHNKQIHGINITGNIGLVPTFCQANNVDNIIIAINNISKENLNKIVDICMVTRCKIRIMPSIEKIMNDEDKQFVYETKKITMNYLSDVKVEDLLGRQSIELSNPLLQSNISGKVVMVTGGGGSIGSELCRQIAANTPKQLIILDYYENNAYEIQQELQRKYGESLNLVIEICNIRELAKVDFVFKKYKPQVLFHAAAHKHVPLMEHNPEEAIKNNVFGTYHVATTAVKYKVEKFTLISSDKAVNPTNVMGSTKRICEMIIQALNNAGVTKFIAVRFGNVLGSNGSVVPLFKNQIADGGPVTVTHPNMVRYFMTIKEAVSLVLTASCINGDGNVYILDMGEPVNIYEFAIKMIRLSGLIPHKDIQLEFTGLRPGEKLYEELLVNETKLKTSHDKIFLENLPSVSLDTIENAISRLHIAIDAFASENILSIVKDLVPTYKKPEKIGKESLIDIGAVSYSINKKEKQNTRSAKTVENKNASSQTSPSLPRT